MGALRTDRVWLLGGLLAIVLLGIGGWFLLVRPKHVDRDNVRAQAGDAQVELTTLNKQLAKLKADQAQLGTLTAKEQVYQRALPSASTQGQTAFLNALQDLGTAENVVVGGLTQGGEQPSATLPIVMELPITLTATGTADHLSAFLNRLQAVQPRALLITTASLSGEGASASGPMTLSLGLKAFRSTATAQTPVLTTTN